MATQAVKERAAPARGGEWGSQNASAFWGNRSSFTAQGRMRHWEVRDKPAAPIRGRDRMGGGGLEGVDHPLPGWGSLRGRGSALPLHGERMRGAARPYFIGHPAGRSDRMASRTALRIPCGENGKATAAAFPLASPWDFGVWIEWHHWIVRRHRHRRNLVEDDVRRDRKPAFDCNVVKDGGESAQQLVGGASALRESNRIRPSFPKTG